MGWASGQDIFDPITKEILKLNIPKDTKARILAKFIDLLKDQDWDTESDSDYWDHPVVGKLLKGPIEYVDQTVVCFTGFRDEALKSFIEYECGASVASSLTQDVTHLLVGKKSLEKGSSKIDKARERGIWVGSVQEFFG